MSNLKEEVIRLIKQHKKEDILFGKPIELILSRIKATREELENEILSCKDISLVEKQTRGSETRYVLYFVYSRKRGRAYVLQFREHIVRIVTVFPLGKITLKKYRKKGLNIGKYSDDNGEF